MGDYVAPQRVVNPEVRAYISSLVSALGGTGADEDGRYVLGDDALACLKDIKRWLRLYDEKTGSLDVARCLAESRLVEGDLLEILASWPEDSSEDKIHSRIALASLELITPLTWPLEKPQTVNHYQHTPYLQLAQITYKRAVLEHWSSGILRTAMRIALPSIALSMGDRTQRDEGIIKLMLYFLRNIAIISAPEDLPVEWNENEVSTSATINAFQMQDVFPLILTIASNMGEDFNTQDVVLLELLFHLIKGINVEKLFTDEKQLEVHSRNDLRGLMEKEAEMLRFYSKSAPTRHNRFGTMIWVKRDDERVSAVSGQDVLGDSQLTLIKMDQSKKFNRPKRAKKEERTHNHFDVEVILNKSAREDFRSFVEDFLDSGFNPLFNHLRRAIEREVDRVLGIHTLHFFYLVGWFLEAERVRRRKTREGKKTTVSPEAESESFGIVASVLNQETFVLLNRFMQDRLDHKEWHDLNAGMRSFTQILLTVQEMADSKLEDDQEIAENIQNRIFYEQTTHDRVVDILRGYKDQGFNYLDAVTELSHVFLRMLERYSKVNADLQVRSKRRARKKEKQSQQQNDAPDYAADQDSEAEELAEAHRVSKERKFDFKRFAAKFSTQNCINAFLALTTFFKSLSNEQLKRAHRFFHRVAFKEEMTVMLFRLDIITLFNKMIKGPDGLSHHNPIFREWEELAKQVFRRLTKRLQTRPELAVELLFSKINATTFFLEYGYEKQTTMTSRAPAELEVKGAMTRDEQIGVVVAVLSEEKMDLISLVKDNLTRAASERRVWEDEGVARAIEENHQPSDTSPLVEKSAPSIVITPGNEERRLAMFKDNKLRLLMSLSGFERIGEDDDPMAVWIIPSSLKSDQLKETAEIIERHRQNPIMQYGEEDPISAEDMLRRKSSRKRTRAEFDDDSEGDFAAPDDEFLFPAGGPTNRKATALEELKKKRRKRKNPDEEGNKLDEETLAARRRARERADYEKRMKIKSTEFVQDSDEEDDQERDRDFFAREETRRNVQTSRVLEAMRTGKLDEANSKKRKRHGPRPDRRNKARISGDEDNIGLSSEADGGLNTQVFDRTLSRSTSPREDSEPFLSESESEPSETPLSSQTEPVINPMVDKLSLAAGSGSEAMRIPDIVVGRGDDDSNTESDAPTAKARRDRQRTRAMLLDDSDEE